MSQEIINKALQKTLISPLTSDLLWSQFLEANSHEIANMEDFYASIKNNWNIEHNDKSNLIRISQSFGYTPNLIINNTLSMTKKEIESIPYRIQEKTTYNGYKLIFQQNGVLGDTFNYYWNNTKLVKGVNYETTLANIIASDHYSPFYGVTPIKNFSMMVSSNNPQLDYLLNGEIVYDGNIDAHHPQGLRYYSLDQKFNPYWKLDTSYTKTPTNHLGIEYFPSIYYCNYKTTLGYAVEGTTNYSTNISMKDYYLDESIKILVNDLELNTTIIVDGDKEYISDDEGVLNPSSYYDKSSGTVNLIFDIVPTDYEIAISYSINIFITSDYFYYLEQGMEYNRRCPIIPHTGVFLIADIAQSRGTDFFHPNSEGYTVEDLKLKAQTTSAYNRYVILSKDSKLDNAKDEYGNPSGEQNYKLDNTIKWFLDSATSIQKSLSSNFKYISCGNKALPMCNEEYNQIFNMSYVLCGYNFNGDDDSSIVTDVSSNITNATIHGDTIKIDGVIDKSLNFNGETWAVSNSALNIDGSLNYTIGIWFNANTEPNTTTEYIFDNFINVSYDYENQELIIESDRFPCTRDENHFLCLNVLASTSTIVIYLDAIQIGTISHIVTSTSSLIYLGVDSSLNNPFYGLIDNIWILIKNLNENEINYINNNKITIISHMGNRLGYYELTEDEIYDDTNYTLVQSYVKAMDITNENFNIRNNNDENYEIQTKFHPILKGYFDIQYTNTLGKIVTIDSNENGEFYNKESGEIVTGSIDFSSGKCTFNKNTIKSLSQVEIDTPDKELMNTIYKITNESLGVITYEDENRQVIPSTSYDEWDLSTATSYTKTNVYHESDSADTDVYEDNDDENYYVYRGTSKVSIEGCIASNDNDENKLYKAKNEKKYYPELKELVTETNNLTAWRDLGESTGTIIYSTDDGSHMFTDIRGAIFINGSTYGDPSKKIRKWKGTVDGVENIYSYTLGVDSATFYSNLQFTSVVNYDSGTPTTEVLSFNKSSEAIRVTTTDLSLELQETEEKYTNVYKIKYIEEMTDIVIITPPTEIVKNSLTFSYYLKDDDGNYKKYTATVNESGQVSGTNIVTSESNFNYTTNKLTVKFEKSLDKEVTASYEYYYTLDIDTNYPLVMNYKTEKSIMINEIGLEDENHELMAYMTFPNIQFHYIYDNVSAMFAINKE